MIVQRTLPVNFNKNDDELFKNEYARELNAAKSIGLKHKLVNRNSQILFTRNLKKELQNNPIQTASFHFRDFFHIIKGNFTYSSIDCALITDGWAKGYFHWLLDTIPRLMQLKKEQKNIKILLHDSFWTSFYKDSLILLGFKEEDFLFYKTNYVFIKSLYCTGYVYPTGNYNEKMIRQIRNLFTESIESFNTIPKSKIYISRRHASKRRLINEEQLLPILESFGYEIYFAENHTLEEQIKTFKNASVLIGVHGAGLTNMLFMSAKAKVLELRFENDKGNNCYYSLASALNIDYYYCLGKNENMDIRIDERSFVKILTELK